MTLEEAAAIYQQQVVIPHCAVCTKPCCKLTDLVLELDWTQTRALYQITSSRKAFDKALPPQIREQGGHYFAHGEPCPAYDLVTRRCNVYGTATKPTECTEFPLYVDGDSITADTRCEAVDIDAIDRALRAVKPDLERVVDDEFDFFVSWR